MLKLNRGERRMTLQLTTLMLGVRDLSRSRAFYANGLGCAIEND